MARKEKTMATATLENEAGTETQVSKNGASKSNRKRVDVEALANENPHERVTLALHVPAEMRVLIRKAAESADVSEAQYVRDVLAGQIGYTVPAEFNERKRRAGTMTDEEKEKIQEAKRQTVAELLKKVQENADAQELLANLGIDISLLPKPRGRKSA
jgi:hypothetical protein